jgi:hypothetical protein
MKQLFMISYLGGNGVNFDDNIFGIPTLEEAESKLIEMRNPYFGIFPYYAIEEKVNFREAGWYWAKINGDANWTIHYWNGKQWGIRDVFIGDSLFDEIDENRIERKE